MVQIKPVGSVKEAQDLMNALKKWKPELQLSCRRLYENIDGMDPIPCLFLDNEKEFDRYSDGDSLDKYLLAIDSFIEGWLTAKSDSYQPRSVYL